MKNTVRFSLAAASALLAPLAGALAQPAPAAPYRVVNTAKVGGEGGFDYVDADSDNRLLYIPRGNRVTVFNLDSLKPAGEIPDTKGVHGVAIDPASHHAFSSSKPVVMWDAQTLATIRTIDVQGRPDGLLFDPFTERVFILSHSSPNVTAIDARDGTVVGTCDLGGAPEQAATDGRGHLYVDLEDKDSLAVVDAKALTVTAHYGLEGMGGGPGGLAIDAKNRILFAFCHEPQNAVILRADDGKILATLPIGNGVDAGEFNPATMEAFSSQRDGTLTVIKENSPTDFVVEQNVATKLGAKTSTLDSKTNQIYLITADRAPAPAAPAPAAAPAPGAPDQPAAPRPRNGRGGAMVPGSFTILVVGR
jgi:DNA-binding beta-propeller fold protein YncE